MSDNTVPLSLDQLLAERRRMKAYIAASIPAEGIEIILADGPDGEVWVDLNPVRCDDGELDLHFETSLREAIGLREIYEHFRQEMTAGEVAPPLAQSDGKKKAHGPAPVAQRLANQEMLTTKEVADLLRCSYGEARKRLLEGRIRAVKDGRWVRTRRGWVEEYVASNTIKPAEKPGTTSYEIPLPSPRRKNCVRVKTTGIGYRFLKNRPK